MINGNTNWFGGNPFDNPYEVRRDDDWPFKDSADGSKIERVPSASEIETKVEYSKSETVRGE